MANPNGTSFCLSVAEKCWGQYFNVSHSMMEDCYLESPCFGNKRLIPILLYPLSVIYILILVLGLIGNVITCLVIITSKYCLLQTTTNRYLLNLALADLVGLISGIPFEIYLIWNQYPWHPPDFFCHLKAWVSETTSYVSVLTIFTFSIERYVAICHSFLMKKFSSSIHRHLAAILFLLWLVAGICAAPFAVYHRTDYLLPQWPGDDGGEYGPVRKSKMCMLAISIDPGLRTVFQVLFHASAIVFFFLPLTALIYLYAKMGRAVKGSKRALNTYLAGRQQSILLPNGDRKVSANGRTSMNSTASVAVGRCDYYSRRTLTILVAVVATFFICYAPYQAQRLLFFYMEDTKTHRSINTYLFFVSGTLFYLSSILNPILYNVISARYRRAFSDVLCHCFKTGHVLDNGKWNSRYHHSTNGHSCSVCASQRPSRSSSQKSILRMTSTANGRNGLGAFEEAKLKTERAYSQNEWDWVVHPGRGTTTGHCVGKPELTQLPKKLTVHCNSSQPLVPEYTTCDAPTDKMELIPIRQVDQEELARGCNHNL